MQGYTQWNVPKVVPQWIVSLTTEELWKAAKLSDPFSPFKSFCRRLQRRCIIWVASESGGGESCWLKFMEIYGSFRRFLIASSSVGSPGRPAVSRNQHQGSCRWAHQTAVYSDLLWRQMDNWTCCGGPQNHRTRTDEEERAERHLFAERAQAFNLAFRDGEVTDFN